MEDQAATIQQEMTGHIARIRATIAAAAERAGRNPDEITLVAVSKTVAVEQVKIAYTLGVRDFGENRVQDALPKIEAFHPEDVRWHMIGHLQSNKASKVVGPFASIQSVDSLHLARALSRYAAEQEKQLPILLEVNVSGEESKNGMRPEETLDLARQIAALPNLEMQGLMTIAPQARTPEEARPTFSGLRRLRDQLREALPQYAWSHLSMGMTDDYSVAIEEGATIVRIGRAIFGERVYTQKGPTP